MKTARKLAYEPKSLKRATSRRRDTRERALVEAENLLVRSGYAAMSMDVVAARIGIQTPSLYHHFPGGKEELLLAVAERRTDEDSKQLIELMQSQTSPIDKFRAAAGYFSTLSGHHPHHALSESRKDLSLPARRLLQGRFAARIEAPLLKIVEDAIAAKQFRPCKPVAAVRAFLMLMLSLGEFEADDPLRAYLPDFLVDLFANGLSLQRPVPPTLRQRKRAR